MTAHWCRDIPRDEAVRAVEDNRTGSLPTLEEAIARPFANTQGTCEQSAPARHFAQPAKCSPAVSETGETQSRLRTERVTEGRPPEPGGGANVTRLRTERVTLEVTHAHQISAECWDWRLVLGPGESVRVVEEDHFDDLAQVAMERDAAIRERDKLRAERITQTLTADRFAEAVAEADALRGRVAELEAAAKFAPVANADGKSNHAEAAASGAAGTELVGWGVRRKGGVDAVVHRLFRSSAEASAEQYGGTVVPLYAAPQPAKGWLTEEEREGVTTMASVMERDAAYFEKCQEPDHANAGWRRAKVFRDLLARSSPPEVVLPLCAGWADTVSRSQVKAALTAAGVPVNEVGK